MKWDEAYKKQHRRTTKCRFQVLRSGAKSRGVFFSLTEEEYTKLVSDPCYHCSGSLPAVGGGLDRVDHTQGYVSGNVVPCCAQCNFAKGRLEGLGFPYKRVIELLHEWIQLRGER